MAMTQARRMLPPRARRVCPRKSSGVAAAGGKPRSWLMQVKYEWKAKIG